MDMGVGTGMGMGDRQEGSAANGERALIVGEAS
jgi:hypothetical protein